MTRPAARRAYRRPIYDTILARAHEPRRFIQVLAGPRQVGKTTLARQVMDAVGVPAHFASADDPALRESGWLETQWEIGRLRARNGGRAGGLLVMDEIQKIPAWSESVKRLWDEDTAAGLPLRVMLLGSAPLLVQKGLTESLAGRFELIRVSHWSFPEMRDSFGWSLAQYLFFGGYPGAADLIGDEERWRRYVLDSLVETTLARDVLLLTRVDKPALLRQLFRLGCERSAEVVPYQRMLGRLTDAGNTTTLAHYLELLAGSGMLTGLPKYGSLDRQRASSPKLLALNTALMTASAGISFADAQADPDFWGRLVETAVGAHLANGPDPGRLAYWKQGSREVDFVVAPRVAASPPLAIEVVSGRQREVQPGMTAFDRQHPGARRLLIGPRGIGIEEFLSEPPDGWLS
ncbi:MAG TPA: AAA family ATPase [Candidatus Limnocylindria bacterium]|nr:AAA family ATPase [Candidatus Limnocylindria bacterium]